MSIIGMYEEEKKKISDQHKSAIKYDLDYIPLGHNSFTCDLWEDTTSTDLFWNKFTSRYAMILGAEFAT